MAKRSVELWLNAKGNAAALIGQVEKSVKSLGGRLASFNKNFGGFGAIMGGSAAISGIKSAINAYGESEKAGAKLEAVLKSTGGAAGMSAEQIKAFASELQSLTTFEDDATVAAAAVLATFKNVNGSAFKEAIRLSQDLSTVMGQDLQSSITQVGKALNDPIKGISALSRVGVSFTKAQKEQIKSLQEAGKIYEAQAIILRELASEFGGAAEAVAKTDIGKIEQMKNAFGDLGETLGSKVAPPLADIAKGLTDIFKSDKVEDIGTVKTPLDNMTNKDGSFQDSVRTDDLREQIKSITLERQKLQNEIAAANKRIMDRKPVSVGNVLGVLTGVRHAQDAADQNRIADSESKSATLGMSQDILMQQLRRQMKTAKPGSEFFSGLFDSAKGGIKGGAAGIGDLLGKAGGMSLKDITQPAGKALGDLMAAGMASSKGAAAIWGDEGPREEPIEREKRERIDPTTGAPTIESRFLTRAPGQGTPIEMVSKNTERMAKAMEAQQKTFRRDMEEAVAAALTRDNNGAILVHGDK